MDLRTVFPIRLPSDLKQAIRIAKQNVADGTISVVESETGQGPGPFDQLTESGGWDDLANYVFACNSCGQRFQLSAETYHGAGGEWKPLGKKGSGRQPAIQTHSLNRRFAPYFLYGTFCRRNEVQGSRP
jgi:hypothetical protein